jgi:hypothetical protein
MKHKALATMITAACLQSAAAAALPLAVVPEQGTPGYTQTFTATGNCVMDWDNSGYQSPGLVVRDCEPFQFFVAVADDYVVGQGSFAIGGNHGGGVFGVNPGNNWGWSYHIGFDFAQWNAWGTINPDGTGTLSFMNNGFLMRTDYVPDFQWAFNHHYPLNQDWAWVLFAENGNGQSWFGDSFAWNVNESSYRALPEPSSLALLLFAALPFVFRKGNK